MPSPDPPVSPEPNAAAGPERKARSATPQAEQRPPEQATFADLVAITLDPMGGRVVRLEYVGPGGERHELSAQDAARLPLSGPETTLERVVEQAFQAGIDCLLGDQAEEDEDESKQDAELSRALLRSLIERSAVTKLLSHDVLDRAIVGTLLEQASVGRAAPARTTPAN